MLQGSIENIIELPEDPADALETLVKLMYGMRWSDAIQDMFLAPKKWNIVLLPETYELATKYQLPNIAKQIFDKL